MNMGHESNNRNPLLNKDRGSEPAVWDRWVSSAGAGDPGLGELADGPRFSSSGPAKLAGSAGFRCIVAGGLGWEVDRVSGYTFVSGPKSEWDFKKGEATRKVIFYELACKRTKPVF